MNALDDLDKKYNSVENNMTESQYLNERIELVKDYTEALNNMYSDEKAMHDMLISQLKKESDVLKDLISKKKESLQADKSESDYQRSIAEKSKNIADKKKQYAMLQGDNSEEAMAQMQKLKVEIADAEQDLDDTQYEKYLERLEDGLNELQDRFDAIIDKIDNQAIAESVNALIAMTENKADKISEGTSRIIDDAGFSEYLKGEDGSVGIGKLNATAEALMGARNDKIAKVYTDTNNELSTIETNTKDTATNTGTTATNTANTAYNTIKTDADVRDGFNSSGKILGNVNNKLTNGNKSAGEILGDVDTNLTDIYTAIPDPKEPTTDDPLPTSDGTLGTTNSILQNILAALSKGDTSQLLDATNGILFSNGNGSLKSGGTETFETIGSGKTGYSGGSDFRAQNKIKTFLSKNATKATMSKSSYGTLNKKIWEITNGKVLSQTNRVKFAKSLGVRTGNSTNDLSTTEVNKIMKLLKNAGFSKGGIVDAVRKNGDDGLATLKVGESVLTPVQTTALMELGDKLAPLNNMVDIIQRPNIPNNIQRSNNSSSTSIDSVNFEFNLPNVVDSESLIKTIQNDTKLQRTLQNATVGKLNGNTRLGVNRL